MKGLSNRISRLEAGGPSELSCGVREWLGHKLTNAEREQAARERAELRDTDWSMFDWAGISAEAREWLTQGLTA